MKNLILIFMLIGCVLSSAQVIINDDQGGNLTPEPSAVLDLRSTTRGLLLPRPDNAPANPVEGLIYYDTTEKCFKGFDGTSWQTIGNACTAVVAPNTAPVATDLEILNSSTTAISQIEVGERLVAFYMYTDAESDIENGSVIQWQSAGDASGLFAGNINGANGPTYTPTSLDTNSFIGFCITPSDGIDPGNQVCTTNFVEVIAAPLPNGRINELHYDNSSTDVNEFLEVRLTNADAGAVSEYNVQFINEDGTDSGSAIPLSTFVLGTNNGIHTYYSFTFPTNGINNQGKGIKVSQNGTVIDFISYEVAVIGATRIVNQANAPIREDGNTVIGSSIQRSESANYWFTTSGFNTKGQPNNDTQITVPTVEFSESAASIAENGGSYTVTTNLTDPGTEAVDIVLTSTEGNGASSTDYTTTFSTTITIAAGATTATFTITGVDDADNDANETVTFEITAVSSATESPVIGAKDAIVITIIDDDSPTAGCTTPINLIEFGFDGDLGDEITKAANTLDSNISSAFISRGTGLNAATNANRFNATGGDATSLADAIAANDYFEIAFDIATGATINVDAFNFNWDRSNTGAPNVAIKSSIDGYNAVLETFTGLNGGANSIADLTSFTNLQALSGTVSFRVYAWGSTSAAGSFGFEGNGRDILITGCADASTPATGASVGFEVATLSYDETLESGTVNITYNNTTANPVTANISDSTNSLTFTDDGTATIPVGSGTIAYDFLWSNNTTADGDATITLTIDTDPAYTVVSNSNVVISIVDDETQALSIIELVNIPEASIQSDWAASFDVTSGTYVANSEGGVRLGSGSKGGLLTYKNPVTFTGTTGNVIVTIGVKGWDSNEKSGIINVGGIAHSFTVNVDRTAATPEYVTHTFTNVSTNSEVSFETNDMNGDERFIIYSILIEKQE